MTGPKIISPWSVNTRPVENAEVPNQDGAKEISPILLFASLDLVGDHSINDFKIKVEKVEAGDPDPKSHLQMTLNSSATASVSSSKTDLSEIGHHEEQTEVHPSSLPENPVQDAPVGRDLTQGSSELFPMSLG